MASLAIFLDGGCLDALCRNNFSGVRVNSVKLSAEIH